MGWFSNIVRRFRRSKRSVVVIPKNPEDQLDYIINALNAIDTKNDIVANLENSPVNLNRPTADRLVSSAHDCIHIIRNNLYFNEDIKLLLSTRDDVELYDFFTAPDGYFYKPSSFIKELSDKLTTIHNLLEEDIRTSRRKYYLRQINPILIDTCNIISMFPSIR